MEARHRDRYYTYKDYLTWPDDVRVELIDGVVYDMAPSPSHHHQRVSTILVGELYAFLKDKPCKLFHAPMDVLFTDEEETDTVVQPDLLVMCDPYRLSPRGAIVGIPTFTIEILSPHKFGTCRA